MAIAPRGALRRRRRDQRALRGAHRAPRPRRRRRGGSLRSDREERDAADRDAVRSLDTCAPRDHRARRGPRSNEPRGVSLRGDPGASRRSRRPPQAKPRLPREDAARGHRDRAEERPSHDSRRPGAEPARGSDATLRRRRREIHLAAGRSSARAEPQGTALLRAIRGERPRLRLAPARGRRDQLPLRARREDRAHGHDGLRRRAAKAGPVRRSRPERARSTDRSGEARRTAPPHQGQARRLQLAEAKARNGVRGEGRGGRSVRADLSGALRREPRARRAIGQGCTRAARVGGSLCHRGGLVSAARGRDPLSIEARCRTLRGRVPGDARGPSRRGRWRGAGRRGRCGSRVSDVRRRHRDGAARDGRRGG